MTTTTSGIPSLSRAAGASRGVPFGRLLRVETRKLFDTRGNLVLSAVLVVLSLALVVGRSVATGEARFFTLTGTAAIVLGVLLPVLGVLTMTGEWSHRTALTTFTLEPRRARVPAAKCVAALAAAVAASLVALLVAALVTAVRGGAGDWTVDPLALLGWIATMILVTGEGLALGLLLRNAPAAIVICLVSPMAWGFVAQLGTTGETLAAWLDLNVTTNALMSGDMTLAAAARLAASALAWIVLPLTAGFLRVLRTDVR
jgi:ABC-2 type transport system permease protein